MAGTQGRFEEYLSEEIRKYNGIAFPVRSSILRRLFVREAALNTLHPNPDDEFCNPDIGPSQTIISNYRKQFVETHKKHDYYCDERLIV